MIRIRRKHLFILLMLAMSSSVVAAVLDSADGPSSELLKSLAAHLHSNMIDVVLGNSLAIDLADRPRVTPLLGYQVKGTDWSTIAASSWGLAFNEGMVGVIIAMKPKNIEAKQLACENEPASDIDGCEFARRWLNAEDDKKVFIAFTKADLKSAEAVKRALEAQGYVVFVFLKPGRTAPWADPSMVGEVFAQAKHKFVIDTKNARGSQGIALESKLCELLLTTSPESKWAKRISKQ